MGGRACVLALLLAVAAAGAERPKPKRYELILHKGKAAVEIEFKGEVGLGECFEVWHKGELVGYAQTAAMDGPWPLLAYLAGAGYAGDTLVPVSLPFPAVELLTDEPKGREVAEFKALCGEKLIVQQLGERMRYPNKDEALVVLIHGGIPFMSGDPIVQPFAREGGTVIADTLVYSHLIGNIADETAFEEPPTIRFVHEGPLTAGLAAESRIPWYGRKGKKFVARYLKGLATAEGKTIVATDGSAGNTAVLLVDLGGRMLVLDIVCPNGRAGMDPGSKNKLVLVARMLGTGPLYARFVSARPEYADLVEWFDELAKENPDRVKRSFEIGAMRREDYGFSYTIGEEGKPLVLLAGCSEGTDWLASTALLRLAEILVSNPTNDPKIPWLLERLRVKIIPVLNVSGYREEKPATASGCLLDRNFPYHWDEYPNKTERGAEPFSEQAAVAIKRAVKDGKAVAFLQVEVVDYDGGYRFTCGRDANDAQRSLLAALRTVVNARLRHRFVLGDKPLRVRLTRDKQRPSAINWVASKGVLAAALKICGDWEDSLVNNDVAIEGCLHFLYLTALSLARQAD